MARPGTLLPHPDSVLVLTLEESDFGLGGLGKRRIFRFKQFQMGLAFAHWEEVSREPCGDSGNCPRHKAGGKACQRVACQLAVDSQSRSVCAANLSDKVSLAPSSSYPTPSSLLPSSLPSALNFEEMGFQCDFKNWPFPLSLEMVAKMGGRTGGWLIHLGLLLPSCSSVMFKNLLMRTQKRPPFFK